MHICHSFRPLYFLEMLNTYTLSVLDFPIILPLCNIANIIECVAMFYFVKRLSALRIVTEPCSDRILLFCCFPILLHHALDVGSFGWGKERLVLLHSEMDNRLDCPFENLTCVKEDVGKGVQKFAADCQRASQKADGLVFLRRGLAHRLADMLLLIGLLFLKLPYRIFSMLAIAACLSQRYK